MQLARADATPVPNTGEWHAAPDAVRQHRLGLLFVDVLVAPHTQHSQSVREV